MLLWPANKDNRDFITITYSNFSQKKVREQFHRSENTIVRTVFSPSFSDESSESSDLSCDFLEGSDPYVGNHLTKIPSYQRVYKVV